MFKKGGGITEITVPPPIITPIPEPETILDAEQQKAFEPEVNLTEVSANKSPSPIPRQSDDISMELDPTETRPSLIISLPVNYREPILKSSGGRRTNDARLSTTSSRKNPLPKFPPPDTTSVAKPNAPNKPNKGSQPRKTSPSDGKDTGIGPYKFVDVLLPEVVVVPVRETIKEGWSTEMWEQWKKNGLLIVPACDWEGI